MEYAATIWDPHTTENIKKVEAVQQRAARFVTGDYRYTSSVTAMTESLSWETLQHVIFRDNTVCTITTLFYKYIGTSDNVG